MKRYDFHNRVPMTPGEKRANIKSLAIDLLNQSHKMMLTKIEKALNSSAIDINEWDENYDKMILPKAIIMAVLQAEAESYNASGTRFEKEMKKTAKNLLHFI